MRFRYVAIALGLVLGGLLGSAWLMVDVALADDPGATASPPIAVQVAKLIAFDGMKNDTFGRSVAQTQDLMVVGMPQLNYSLTDTQPGAAYVFARNADGSNEWTELAKLTASDGAPDDRFGYYVAVSGDTVVVGAPRASVAGRPQAGAAYVFSRNQGGPDIWGEVTRLTASDAFTQDMFGSAVTIDDSTIVVGANGDNIFQLNVGSAYVFYRDVPSADQWGQVRKIAGPGGQPYDEFGISVSLDGDTLVVGAHQPGNSLAVPPVPPGPGAAYVFYRDVPSADQWGQVKKLNASDGHAGDQLGWSVSVSGDTAVAGANGADISSRVAQGAAYVFTRGAGGTDNWGQVKKITATGGAEGDRFGYAVSANADLSVVGAPLVDFGSEISQGAAYVFGRDEGGAGTWGQVYRLVALDGTADDRLGLSVSALGDTFLVGAPYDEIGAQQYQGAAYVFIAGGQLIHLPVIEKR